ncbi:MAG: hypothetical protein ABW072_07590, partial [Sedimenticola sp.]
MENSPFFPSHYQSDHTTANEVYSVTRKLEAFAYPVDFWHQRPEFLPDICSSHRYSLGLNPKKTAWYFEGG